MKTIIRFPASVILLAVISFGAFITATYSQPKDTVLVPGSPPLTQSIVYKTVDFMEFTLDIELSPKHEDMLKEILVRIWKTKSQDEIKSTLDIVDMHNKLHPLTQDQRNAMRDQMQGPIIENLRKGEDDEMARILVSAFDATHSSNSRTPTRSNVSTGTPRVGTDGLTGIWRMLRPRALNIDNNVSESGYYIDHITFLPNGNVYWTLPPEGLLNFDAAVAKRAYPDDWGTYTIKNGAIEVIRGPSKELYVITRSGERLNNPPSLGKGSFRPVPPADGLRLEGTYRRDATEPAISFTKDGSFRDEGVFGYFGDLARPNGTIYQDDGRGGSGTLFDRAKHARASIF